MTGIYWALVQTVEIPPDAQFLIDNLSYLIGAIIVPVIGVFKRYIPSLNKIVPFEHWKLILTFIIAFVVTLVAGLDLSLKEIADSVFQATGAAGFLYGGKKLFGNFRGRKRGNE